MIPEATLWFLVTFPLQQDSLFQVPSQTVEYPPPIDWPCILLCNISFMHFPSIEHESVLTGPYEVSFKSDPPTTHLVCVLIEDPCIVRHVKEILIYNI